MAERMFEFQYEPGEELVFRFRPPKLNILPKAAKGHIKEANKEFLLALRSMLDDAIECIEKEETKKSGPKKIKVE
ncbi:MAG: hypothetical protein HYX82_03525 [Chloroflexi bacterium]|nr:hypothetical protein [Chloroflexota bacterium]